MAVPTSISDLSTTPGSNPPSGSDSPTVTDDHFRAAYSFIKTLDNDKAEDTDVVKLTGNQTIAGTKTFSADIAGNITGSAAGTALNVTGVVTTTHGGTGSNYADAAAVFNGIKQSASATATGVVELATDAEARNGVDASRAVVPANLTATVLGMGQVLTDFTSSRSLNTTYTNGGKTTVINVRVITTAGSGSGNFMGVTTTGGQQQDGSASGSAGAGWVLTVSALIPPNSPYSVNINNATLQSWKEFA